MKHDEPAKQKGIYEKSDQVESSYKERKLSYVKLSLTNQPLFRSGIGRLWAAVESDWPYRAEH